MIGKYSYRFLLFACLCYTTSVRAQDLKGKVAAAYEAFVTNGKLNNGIASLTVLDGKSGTPIFSSNAAVGFPTASTMKVITAITALDILGPNFTYETQLSYSGEVDSLGVLHGDIIITGSGDPTLGSDRYASTKGEVVLDKWISKIKHAGIRHVAGRVIGNDLHFNGYDVPGGWPWDDIGNYYGAGISGLNWQENKVGVTFAPSTVGQRVSLVKTTSALQGINLVNEVATGPQGSGDNVYAYSAPYSTVIYLRGTYGKDLKKEIEISVPDPALALAQQLTTALSEHGILTDSLPDTGKRLQDGGQRLSVAKAVLDVHVSPPLKEIVYWFNQKSVNLYGEALLKSFGLRSGNKSDTKYAATLLSKYWEQKLRIPIGELQITDGSGLSPQTRVTTMAMAKIMYYAQSRPWFTDFQKSLPEINNTRMKSGTISAVLGYTGYQTSKTGVPVVFSVLLNNYAGSTTAMRQELFKLLDILK
ncbi:D-alanyl-D-alanine carboxypeptidase/D-alanyl-D-alanine endopeptidase [Sphingobacterium sp. LRF_L2]|uniref:D-alanyl-D-alanine carboxypeptidase/D-alanyl-D-alanine endopeptidase n=1 Tax=Sphingobacterium sp. LRF_L2 TaxID=3369421 RepID=UPI003F5F1E6B